MYEQAIAFAMACTTKDLSKTEEHIGFQGTQPRIQLLEICENETSSSNETLLFAVSPLDWQVNFNRPGLLFQFTLNVHSQTYTNPTLTLILAPCTNSKPEHNPFWQS